VLDGGGYSVQENSTATVNVVADFDVAGLSIGAIAVTGTGAAGASPGSLVTNLTWGSPVQHGTAKDGSVNGIYIWQVTGSLAAETGKDIPVSAGTAVYSFTVQTGAAGTSLYVDDWMGTNPFGGAPFPVATEIGGYAAGTTDAVSAVLNLSGLQLSVVPEPMTVVLLGLGGLFLRRRK
jgi:hypothetical protein